MKTPELGSVKTRPKCVQFHHSDPYLKLGPFQVEIVSMQPYRPVYVLLSIFIFILSSFIQIYIFILSKLYSDKIMIKSE